ncbi:MAG TPA: hypothetical protein VN621_05060 [Arthrobacter sp.]|nr:hypothetical protein [Arthrobacter sp.]
MADLAAKGRTLICIAQEMGLAKATVQACLTGSWRGTAKASHRQETPCLLKPWEFVFP